MRDCDRVVRGACDDKLSAAVELLNMLSVSTANDTASQVSVYLSITTGEVISGE